MNSAPAILLSSGSLSCAIQHPAAVQPVTVICSAASPLELCREALRNSLDYPPLRECVIPGDRVALVQDAETAELPELLTAILEVLASVPDEGVSPVLILPADPAGLAWESLRGTWPETLRKIPTVIHDPADRTLVSYVASTAAGERIYLNREAAEADVLITVGRMRFDSIFGVLRALISTGRGRVSSGEPWWMRLAVCWALSIPCSSCQVPAVPRPSLRALRPPCSWRERNCWNAAGRPDPRSVRSSR